MRQVKEPFGLHLGDILGPALKGAGLTLQGPIIRKRKGLGDYKPTHGVPKPWLRAKKDRRVLPEEIGER
jgi:hypothetical protein